MSQLFGCGSVAQTVLSKGALGEPLTIHVGFTLGVMMAVYMAGGVSGTEKNCCPKHLTPTTTLPPSVDLGFTEHVFTTDRASYGYLLITSSATWSNNYT